MSDDDIDAPKASAHEVMPALTLAESFAGWWDANIRNSPVSRDTSAYNKAHELRSQFLAIFNSVTGE